MVSRQSKICKNSKRELSMSLQSESFLVHTSQYLEVKKRLSFAWGINLISL